MIGLLIPIIYGINFIKNDDFYLDVDIYPKFPSVLLTIIFFGLFMWPIQLFYSWYFYSSNQEKLNESLKINGYEFYSKDDDDFDDDLNT